MSRLPRLATLTLLFPVLAACSDAAPTAPSPRPIEDHQIAGTWRMAALEERALPTVYAVYPDEELDGRIVDVEIRLDSARMLLHAQGDHRYGRTYWFTELHDGAVAFRHQWGDFGGWRRTGPSLDFESHWIQNLRARGEIAAVNELRLREPLWHGEAPRATRWVPTLAP